jgi:hypothetical protein
VERAGHGPRYVHANGPRVFEVAVELEIISILSII